VLTIHQAIELENNSEDTDSSWPEYPHWTVLSSGSTHTRSQHIAHDYETRGELFAYFIFKFVF
jgi:hypothetical protein